MQSLLNDIIAANVTAFLLIFMRFGMALMIMPGIGDSFVSPQLRLLFAVAMSFVLTPFLAPGLPPLPAEAMPLAMLLVSEAVIGLFIGTVMRILIAALDTAGSVVSMQSGFSGAVMFNPVTASQGSLVGALYSSLGVTLLLTADLHHQMLAAVVESYRLFPAQDGLPDAGSMSEAIGRTVSIAFRTGVQISIPFLVVGTIVQAGFGVLGRLMPQVQIFFLALPVQIFLGLLVMSMVLSASMVFWLSGYEAAMTSLLAP